MRAARVTLRLALAAAVVPVPVSGPASAETILVDPTGDGYRDIAAAVAEARPGDTVLVAPGEYRLDAPVDLAGKAIALRSREGAGRTTLRLSDSPAEPSRASLLLFESGEGAGTVVDGFTLEGGRGTARCGACLRRGGALWCVGSSPTLRDLRIRGSSAAGGGGIFIADRSSPTLEDCLIEGNAADFGGGALVSEGCAPVFRRCAFDGNRAATGGGVCLLLDADARFEECRVSGNHAEEGGGIAMDGAAPAIARTRIIANAASLGAGLLVQYRSAPAVEGSAVVANAAETWGGGIFSEGSFLAISETTIAWNVAGPDGEGGGLYAERSLLEIDHATIARNRGGAIALAEGTPASTITSSIVRGGIYVDDGWCCFQEWTPADSVGMFGDPAPLQVSYSCTELSGLLEDESFNHDEEPGFCGWGSGDATAGENPDEDLFRLYSFALQESSPCLGAGADGTNAGASFGTCAAAPAGSLRVALAPGTYRLAGLDLDGRVSLVGAGREETILVGTLHGLGPGRLLSRVTVTGGDSGGVRIAGPESADAPGGADAEIREARIVANEGGGVWVGPGQSLELRDVEVALNGGSGIVCQKGSTPTIERCAITRNGPAPEGSNRRAAAGGVSVDRAAHPLLRSSLVAGNTGPGVELASEAGITAIHATIAGNDGPGLRAGNLDNADNKISLRGSIVHGNAGGSLVLTAGVPAPEVSFSSVGGGPWAGEGNLDADPRLEGAGDWRLRAGSPARDAVPADEEAGTLDLDGAPRLACARADMGAYEAQDCGDPSEIEFLRGDPNRDGRVDITDPIAVLAYLFLGGKEPRCLEAGDADDTGSVNLTDAIVLLEHLFRGGPEPEPPYPLPGIDPTPDDLPCR